MKKLICNYSVLRFLPYPETKEFVNVGVVACCPQVGWMDYCIENRKTKRVHDFFPEMDMNLFIAGRHRLTTELDRLLQEFRLADPRQWVQKNEQVHLNNLFLELTREREEIFRMGPPATMMTDDPAGALTTCFTHYVERHFAQHQEYQETVMRKRMTNILRNHDLLNRFKERRLGNEGFHVNLPFVETGDNGEALRAMKPLNLTQNEATDIRNHGDVWKAKMDRLQRMQKIPAHMMFAVNVPPKNDRKRYNAAEEICEMYREADFRIVDFENQDALIRFAE